MENGNMKVVILAAGRSVRMQPAADKNFLNFLGRPLISHQLGALARASFSDILIMGGRHNLNELKKLAGGFCEENKGVKITVKEQKDLDLGMAGALISAEPWIKNEPFLAVSANDMVSPRTFDLVRAGIRENEGILAAQKVKSYFPGGYLKTSRSGIINTIVEKPGQGKEPGNLVNIVIHYHPFPKLLLGSLKKISSRSDDGYEKALQSLFNSKIIYRALPCGGFWQAVKYPWHVLDLMNYFLERMKPKKSGAQIAKTAVIKGKVCLEDGVKVLDNAVIQGPAYIGANTVIATNALVRQSHIGENCVIGFGSEIARSYVGDGVWTHANYIGDSVIGNDVSFGAGAITGNLRLDEKNIRVRVNGDKIDCGRNKFGLVTGNHIRVGVHTSFMPGVKIGGNSMIGAGLVINEDIPEGSFVTGKWEIEIKKNKTETKERVTGNR